MGNHHVLSTAGKCASRSDQEFWRWANKSRERVVGLILGRAYELSKHMVPLEFRRCGCIRYEPVPVVAIVSRNAFAHCSACGGATVGPSQLWSWRSNFSAKYATRQQTSCVIRFFL